MVSRLLFIINQQTPKCPRNTFYNVFCSILFCSKNLLCDEIWTSLFVCFSVAGTTTAVWLGLCAVCVKLRVLQLCSPASWRLSSGMFLSLRSTSCSTARPRLCCPKVRKLKLTGYNGLQCLVLFILSVTVITYFFIWQHNSKDTTKCA